MLIRNCRRLERCELFSQSGLLGVSEEFMDQKSERYHNGRRDDENDYD